MQRKNEINDDLLKYVESSDNKRLLLTNLKFETESDVRFIFSHNKEFDFPEVKNMSTEYEIPDRILETNHQSYINSFMNSNLVKYRLEVTFYNDIEFQVYFHYDEIILHFTDKVFKGKVPISKLKESIDRLFSGEGYERN